MVIAAAAMGWRPYDGFPVWQALYADIQETAQTGADQSREEVKNPKWHRFHNSQLHYIGVRVQGTIF